MDKLDNLQKDLRTIVNHLNLTDLVSSEVLQERLNSYGNGATKSKESYQRIRNRFKTLTGDEIRNLCKLYKADFEMFRFEPVYEECEDVLNDSDIWPSRLEKFQRKSKEKP